MPVARQCAAGTVANSEPAQAETDQRPTFSKPLVWTLHLMVRDVLAKRAVEMVLAKQDHPVQALGFDRKHLSRGPYPAGIIVLGEAPALDKVDAALGSLASRDAVLSPSALPERLQPRTACPDPLPDPRPARWLSPRRNLDPRDARGTAGLDHHHRLSLPTCSVIEPEPSVDPLLGPDV